MGQSINERDVFGRKRFFFIFEISLQLDLTISHFLKYTLCALRLKNHLKLFFGAMAIFHLGFFFIFEEIWLT